MPYPTQSYLFECKLVLQSHQIYELVNMQGYEGSYETVKRFVGQIKGERDRVDYLRFETQPGLQAQVDLADFKVTCGNGSELLL